VNHFVIAKWATTILYFPTTSDRASFTLDAFHAVLTAWLDLQGSSLQQRFSPPQKARTRTPIDRRFPPPENPCAGQSGPSGLPHRTGFSSGLKREKSIVGWVPLFSQFLKACTPGSAIVQNVHTSRYRDMAKVSRAAFAFVLAWSTSALSVETPAARVYRALTDVCLDRHLKDSDLNAAQLNTGRPLIVHCDCMARFLFSYMDAEAIRELETRIPDKITSNWDDAALRCTTLILR
jgi:hypothetical protein